MDERGRTLHGASQVVGIVAGDDTDVDAWEGANDGGRAIRANGRDNLEVTAVGGVGQQVSSDAAVGPRDDDSGTDGPRPGYLRVQKKTSQSSVGFARSSSRAPSTLAAVLVLPFMVPLLAGGATPGREGHRFDPGGILHECGNRRGHDQGRGHRRRRTG